MYCNGWKLISIDVYFHIKENIQTLVSYFYVYIVKFFINYFLLISSYTYKLQFKVILMVPYSDVKILPVD